MYDVRRYYHAVAPFLDAELADRGDKRLWQRIGREHSQGSILEIGCGTGRVTGWLAPAGGRVVGIDVCPELLELAQRRLGTRHTALSTQPSELRTPSPGLGTRHSALGTHLVLADMRQLPFRRCFDLIVAPDDPFSHLLVGVDRDQALHAVASALAPDGRFVLDALWFPSSELGRRAGSSLVAGHEVAFAGHPLHISERWRCNTRSHCCTAEFDYEDAEHATTHARFRARYWTVNELRRRFRAAGLEIISLWGAYDQRPWHERRSKHLIVEARLTSDQSL